jgi:hypothetical protein
MMIKYMRLELLRRECVARGLVELAARAERLQREIETRLA